MGYVSPIRTDVMTYSENVYAIRGVHLCRMYIAAPTTGSSMPSGSSTAMSLDAKERGRGRPPAGSRQSTDTAPEPVASKSQREAVCSQLKAVCHCTSR
jgi:hypothetical protein